MGRPKGSKNKPKVIDASARIAEIDREVENYAAQVVELEDQIAQTASILSEQKANLRAVTRTIKNLEKEKANLQDAAEKQQREQEARRLVDSFLDSGNSLDDLKRLLS